MPSSRRALVALPLLVAVLTTACATDDPFVPEAVAASTDSEPPDADMTDDAPTELAADVPLPEIPEQAVDLRDEAQAVVVTTDNRFTERIIIVEPGTTVTWVNAGVNPHNVLPANDGAFESIPTDDFEPGSTASITFDAVGDYPYYCSIHGTPTNGQRGQVLVIPA